jgi:predicted glycoside hydrolase/deacetylase ChbG (UPF0249 family)
MEPSAFRSAGDRRSMLQEWVSFLERLNSLRGDVIVEVPCHPAYVDDELRRYASYIGPREEEVAALRSPELRTAVTRAGIKLVDFAAV